jgi:hypothetical protein
VISAKTGLCERLRTLRYVFINYQHVAKQSREQHPCIALKTSSLSVQAELKASVREHPGLGDLRLSRLRHPPDGDSTLLRMPREAFSASLGCLPQKQGDRSIRSVLW